MHPVLVVDLSYGLDIRMSVSKSQSGNSLMYTLTVGLIGQLMNVCLSKWPASWCQE